MTGPTISDLRAKGYRMSANAGDAIVSRCAAAVKRDYLSHYVTEADIEAADMDSALGRAWCSLTFVAYLRQVEFGTRTGGEKKSFSYGEHLSWMQAAKADAATALKELKESFPPKSDVVDSLEIYFKTQILR